MTLPPGQRPLEGFPRFGTHLQQPPPPVPDEPEIEISGAVRSAATIRLAEVMALPRRQLTADFHCVAGWSATNLHWEGVPFQTFYREFVEPSLRPSAGITHVVFVGLDGYRWTALIEDARDESVILADRLNGHPLTPGHGAPVRLVSPSQYGHVNVKHLSRVEVLSGRPPENYGAPSRWVELGLRSPLIKPHPRARVWREERHRYLPGALLRPAYRLLIPPIRSLSRHGGGDSQKPDSA